MSCNMEWNYVLRLFNAMLLHPCHLTMDQRHFSPTKRTWPGDTKPKVPARVGYTNSMPSQLPPPMGLGRWTGGPGCGEDVWQPGKVLQMWCVHGQCMAMLWCEGKGLHFLEARVCTCSTDVLIFGNDGWQLHLLVSRVVMVPFQTFNSARTWCTHRELWQMEVFANIDTFIS